MKQAEVHQTLTEPELRDWIGASFMKTINEGGYGPDLRKHLENELAELQKRIEACKRYEALSTILEMKGWEWFDTSDYIVDYSPSTFYGFVGTKEEREKVFGPE